MVISLEKDLMIVDLKNSRRPNYTKETWGIACFREGNPGQHGQLSSLGLRFHPVSPAG
jgi:hypothetical protein